MTPHPVRTRLAFACVLAFIVACLALWPRVSLAQDAGVPRDGGAPKGDAGNGAKDGGAGDLAPQDSGTPTGGTGTTPPDDEPLIRIPPSDAERAEGQPILAIEVSGNRRVAADDVAAYLKLKRGGAFNATTLATDVRALWDAGFFDDIKVDLTRNDQGVRLASN